MMEKNVGLIDSYIRLTGGLFFLGYGITRASTVMMALGAMKAAEGITRFCPMLYLLDMSTVEKKGEKDGKEDQAAVGAQ